MAHNQKSLRKLMEKNGWRMVRGGKHAVKMEKSGMRPVTLPMHHGDDYGPSLEGALLKQAGLK